MNNMNKRDKKQEDNKGQKEGHAPLLALRNIVKSYPGPRGREAGPVLHDFDLSVHAGEILCLLGPSGCGKSTLLRIAASLDSDYEGQVIFAGRPVNQPARERILIFQNDDQCYPWLMARDNVAFALKGRKAERYQTADRLLTMVGLAPWAGQFPRRLSGGQRQRLALARALAAAPQLLLMDEPFSSLDRDIRRRLRNLILKIRKETGCTILFVTHDVEEALYMGDRIAVMNQQGSLVDNSPNTLPLPRDVYSAPFIDSIKNFDLKLRSF